MTDECGAVVVSRHLDGDGRYLMRIDWASPLTAISPEMLSEVMDGALPWIEVTGDQQDQLIMTDDFGGRFVYDLGVYEVLWDAFRLTRVTE